MAVIRAQRLWVASTAIEIAGPEILYIVPDGKRAIIRTITVTLHDVPANDIGAPYFRFYLTENGVTHNLLWGWFLPPVGQPFDEEPAWELTHTWAGQIVLHSGDMMSWTCVNSALGFTTHASGHELNEIQL